MDVRCRVRRTDQPRLGILARADLALMPRRMGDATFGQSPRQPMHRSRAARVRVGPARSEVPEQGSTLKGSRAASRRRGGEGSLPLVFSRSFPHSTPLNREVVISSPPRAISDRKRRVYLSPALRAERPRRRHDFRREERKRRAQGRGSESRRLRFHRKGQPKVAGFAEGCREG